MARLTATSEISPLPWREEGQGDGSAPLPGNLAPTQPPRVAGALHATFTPTGARVHARAPLELRGPFPNATYYLRNTTAGIFGGDSCAIDIHAESASTTRVSSPSATKVYAASGRTASTTLNVEVAANATLVWGPHASIVQAGARLDQRTSVSIAPAATAILAEVLVLGRLASGERYAFDRLASALEVTGASGRPLYSEAYNLTASDDLATAMGQHGALVSVYGLGLATADAAAALEPLSLDAYPLAGFSALPNCAGIIVRMLAESLSEGLDFATLVTGALAPSGRV
jgi:urease accessory protein